LYIEAAPISFFRGKKETKLSQSKKENFCPQWLMLAVFGVCPRVLEYVFASEEHLPAPERY
jgi:hypothetical protein